MKYLKIFLPSLIAAVIAGNSPAINRTPTQAQQLYEAVLFQDVPKIKELLSKGANPNEMTNGRPLLGWASQNGNLEVVQTLINGKADVNKADEGAVGHTPLMRAIETGHPDIVQALLDAKANPNATTPDGETCLNMGVKSRKPGIVSALLKAGANPSYVSKEGDSPALTAAQDAMPESLEIIKILGQSKANMDASNLAYTPLTYAISQSNIDLIKTLLDAGANPNAKTQSGSVPINLSLDNQEILQILIDAKADPNITDESGDFPLLNAVRYGNVEAVKTLLKAKVDVNKKDQYGNTPLEVARQNFNNEIIDILSPYNKPEGNNAGLEIIPIENDPTGTKCSIVDAARRQMEIHGLLQAEVDAGKMSSEIFRTFSKDTEEYGKLLTTEPDKACQLLEKLRTKYGLKH